MALLLLVRKRYLHTILFLACFAVLAGAYMYYMKTETGLIVLSKKAILAKNQPVTGSSYHSHLLPVLPVMMVIRHIPFVAYHFLEALFLPFIALIILGFRRVEKDYRLVLSLLVISHLLSIATISASSRRFSVEFIPLVLPFAVEGLFVLSAFLERYRYKQWYFRIAVILIVAASLFQGFVLPDKGRGLHKKAGLYLRSIDPGSVILARLPLVAFYARGEWVNVQPFLRNGTDCNRIIDIMRENHIRYIALDDRLNPKLLPVAECTFGLTAIAEFRENEDFVKVYRLKNG
jgi:hypothetical protein